jgi:hypothetical protein
LIGLREIASLQVLVRHCLFDDGALDKPELAGFEQ